MRGIRLSHGVFAVTMIALGAIGLVKGDFAQMWQPVPKFVPAVVVGVLARLAAALAALQIWMFLVLVWLPVLAKGNISPFDWAELLTTWVIGSGGWVVADSYRERPWFAVTP